MKIITSFTDFENLVKLAAEGGIQSVVNSNQYGKKFFSLYGNTFPIKDKLSQLGFKYFKGTWGDISF